jgi:hypothetical protein
LKPNPFLPDPLLNGPLLQKRRGPSNLSIELPINVTTCGSGGLKNYARKFLRIRTYSKHSSSILLGSPASLTEVMVLGVIGISLTFVEERDDYLVATF